MCVYYYHFFGEIKMYIGNCTPVIQCHQWYSFGVSVVSISVECPLSYLFRVVIINN